MLRTFTPEESGSSGHDDNIRSTDFTTVYSKKFHYYSEYQLEIWARAQRKAARLSKFDCGDFIGGRNSANSNATWRMQLH